MLKTIKNAVGRFLHSVKKALDNEPRKSLPPPPQDEPEHAKKRARKRGGKNRKHESPDGRPYVRAADRRPATTRPEAQPPAKEKIPNPKKNQQQHPKPKSERIIPPMPEIVIQPDEPGKLRFTDLELAPEILAAAQDLGFQYCTPIQQQCLPYALAGNDLAAKAQTGTGKTAAFLASVMTRLLAKPISDGRKNGAARVLVLAPTRELAIQIHKDAESLSKYAKLNNLVIFGGMDYKGQRDALDEPLDILVGTPGRIIDYSRGGFLDLSRVECLVIDEADRMLDMGFIPDVRRIVSKLPQAGVRQTMLFSATLAPEILRLVDSWLKNPVSLETEREQMVTDLIEQRFYAVLRDDKPALLLNLIKRETPERMIIFGNWKDRNRDLVRKLYTYGFNVELLSGDIAQSKRLKVLEKFRSGECKLLVATDVAARGIHVDGVTHVVNYDLPDQPDDYVHRVGRTGRAGATGISISFVCELGAFALPAIEEYAVMKVQTIQPDPEMLVLPEKVRAAPPRDPADEPRGHGRGSRSGGGRPPRRGGPPPGGRKGRR